MSKRLYRSESDKILGGVCGGIADYFDLDPTLVRLAVILLELATAGSALLLYLIAWIIIPTESEVKSVESRTDEKEAEEDTEEEGRTEEKFTCDECGKEFESQHGLNVHKGQKH